MESAVKQLESVKSRLETLPNKTRYPIQVPFGSTLPGQPPLLLMRGYIKHTNEVLVLLGDNWFVERSAKESADIIDRRIKRTKTLIDKFNEEKKQHEEWVKFVETITDEQQNLVEIKEDYDEEVEKKWREEHRRRVKESKQKSKQSQTQDILDGDLDIMTRLQLLEDEEEEEMMRIQQIKEKTLREKILSSQGDSGTERDVNSEKQLKGILKKREEKERPLLTGEEKGGRHGQQDTQHFTHQDSSPFTGQVVERPVAALPPLETGNASPSTSSGDQKKPVSLFKASRMKK